MKNYRDKTTKKSVVFAIEGQRYEAFPAIQEWDEEPISGERLSGRAERFDADLDEKDGEFILDFQGQISGELSGKKLVFAQWEDEGGMVAIAQNAKGCWKPEFPGEYDKSCWLVRRVLRKIG